MVCHDCRADGELGARDSACFLVNPLRAVARGVKYESRVEVQRDASLRATEIVVTAFDGVVEIEDSAGYGLMHRPLKGAFMYSIFDVGLYIRETFSSNDAVATRCWRRTTGVGPHR